MHTSSLNYSTSGRGVLSFQKRRYSRRGYPGPFIFGYIPERSLVFLPSFPNEQPKSSEVQLTQNRKRPVNKTCSVVKVHLLSHIRVPITYSPQGTFVSTLLYPEIGRRNSYLLENTSSCSNEFYYQLFVI